jgi:hypothetical protein
MGDKDFYEPTKRTQFVWVKDRVGNEYVCSADYLKDPKNVSAEELKNCVDDASVYQASAGG